MHSVSQAEQVGLQSIEVTFNFFQDDTNFYQDPLIGCLDKVIYIREQWLNPLISLA